MKKIIPIYLLSGFTNYILKVYLLKNHSRSIQQRNIKNQLKAVFAVWFHCDNTSKIHLILFVIGL